jgi:acyl dehydratase
MPTAPIGGAGPDETTNISPAQIRTFTMSSEIAVGEHEDRIGNVVERDVGAVTRREVRRYTRAVEDPNPLFHDLEYVREHGYDDLVVPPNYLPAVIDYGEGPPTDDLREDGLDPTAFPVELPPEAVLMGGGQDLTFERYLFAGEPVMLTETFADIYQRKSDRMGTLTFLEVDSEFAVDDDLVIHCEETMIVGDRQ